jgi:hypothetical protein
LNASAARVCRALLAGEPAQAIAEDLARRFGVEARTALADVQGVRAKLLDDGSGRGEPSAPLSFEAREAGFDACLGDRPLWRLRGSELSFTGEEHELDLSFRWLLPHLLIHRGHRVLHAAANVFEDGVHAYVGPSGAGKTTLAEAFEKAGRPVASRDLLLLGDDANTVWLAAEERLHCSSDVEEIEALIRGPAAPLSLIAFLDAERRERGRTEIALERMPASEALGALLLNAFGELGRPVWPHLLRFLHPLARDVPAHRATLPDGLDALFDSTSMR